MSDQDDKNPEDHSDFEDEITQATPDEEIVQELARGREARAEELEKKCKELEDKYLRSVAEIDNYRKRAAKERDELVHATSERFLKELLEVKDHLEMALSHSKSVHGTGEVKGLRDGVELTLKQLANFLKKFGVEEIGVLGDAFNPAFHEAIHQEQSLEYKPGSVVHVYQKGYLLNGRLLRAARVTVAALLVLMLMVGCATGGGAGKGGKSREIDFSRLQKTPEMERSFQAAEKFYYARRLIPAKDAYESYLKEFPYNALTPKTWFRLGEIAFAEKDCKQAIADYRKAGGRGLDPDWGTYAIYKQAVCYSNMDQQRRVLTVLDEIPVDNADKKVAVRAGSLRVTTANKLDDATEAKKGYLEVIDAYVGLSPGEAKVGDLNWLMSDKTARDEIRSWIATEETKGDTKGEDLPRIKRWYPRFEGKVSGSFLCWKIARLYDQGGDYKNADEWARRYTQAYPKDEYAAAARAMVAEIAKRGGGGGGGGEAVSAEGRAVVGVLLPLSGKYAVYGESVLHGIECAAGVYAPCRGDLGINLLIRDTQGSPALAAKIVDEFARNQDVRAVIGPLPQVEVDQAVAAAESASLPMISLSQKPDVARQGQFIFRNFLTVSDQVASVVGYGCGEKRWKKLAILYPAGQAGEEYKKAFEEEVDRCGGKVVAQASYPPETKNFTNAIRDLTSVPFNALFVPDVYRKIPLVASAIQSLGIQDVHLLGGAGWDHPALLTGGASATGEAQGLEGAVYVNGFFSKSMNFTIRDFVSTFQASYGMEPTLLEAYAFDTTRLLGEVLKDTSTTDRLEIQKALARKRNFSGVTGNISFDEDGDARRRLSILTIEQGEVREVK